MSKKVVTTQNLRIDFGNFQNSYLMKSKDSIARNSHMNTLKGVQPPDERVKEKLMEFVFHCQENITAWENKIMTGDVLNELTNQAQILFKEKRIILDEIDKAIVVDFINYVGMCCCVDYALYTSDI